MDWIERVFHISPDGGNGSLEMFIFVGIAVAVAMVLVKVLKLGPKIRAWSQSARARDQQPKSSVNRPN